MKIVTQYQWEPQDPSRRHIRHAIAALTNLQRPEDQPSISSVAKVIEGPFTIHSIRNTASYLRELAARAIRRAQDYESESVASARQQVTMMAAALRSAASAAQEAAETLLADFEAALAEAQKE